MDWNGRWMHVREDGFKGKEGKVEGKAKLIVREGGLAEKVDVTKS